VLGQEPVIQVGRSKEGGNATTKLKGNSVLIRKKMEYSRAVILKVHVEGK